MGEFAFAAVIVSAFLAGILIGGVVAYWTASRSFEKSLDEIDIEHHRDTLERNYNFLKLNRKSDRWKDRHWWN